MICKHFITKKKRKNI